MDGTPHRHAGIPAMSGRSFERRGPVPPGILNVVTNAPRGATAMVEVLIAHPSARRADLTGSTRDGRLIPEQATRHLKPVLLKLGGKASLLAPDDTDLRWITVEEGQHYPS